MLKERKYLQSKSKYICDTMVAGRAARKFLLSKSVETSKTETDSSVECRQIALLWG